MDDNWQDIPPIPDNVPEHHRERLLATFEEYAAVDREARALLDEHGWERANALGDRLVKQHPKLRLLIEMGWVVSGMEGVIEGLNYHARELARDGFHDTAVVMRMIALNGAGPPGDPGQSFQITDFIASELDDLRLALPTREEWDAANVDAVMQQAALTVEWDPDAHDQ